MAVKGCLGDFQLPCDISNATDKVVAYAGENYRPASLEDIKLSKLAIEEVLGVIVTRISLTTGNHYFGYL